MAALTKRRKYEASSTKDAGLIQGPGGGSAWSKVELKIEVGCKEQRTRFGPVLGIVFTSVRTAHRHAGVHRACVSQGSTGTRGPCVDCQVPKYFNLSGLVCQFGVGENPTQRLSLSEWLDPHVIAKPWFVFRTPELPAGWLAG